MPLSRPARPFTGRKLIALAASAALVVGGGTVVVLAANGSQDAARAERPAASSAPENRGAAGGLQDPAAPGTETTATEAIATRVEIPKIGVDSTLEQLPLDVTTGELTPPVEWMSAGWYRDGTVPGDKGPAVIAGHVDSTTGPAVFARLGELAPGDQIRVTLSNGETREFIVDSQRRTPKDAFPTEEVYGPTPTAELRLITCDGVFNGSTGHYLDNLIINAHLA